jgi:hypothetical protein
MAKELFLDKVARAIVDDLMPGAVSVLKCFEDERSREPRKVWTYSEARKHVRAVLDECYTIPSDPIP